MKLAITGHTNIEKASGFELVRKGGVKYNLEAFETVYQIIDQNLKSFLAENNINLEDITLISGMARGIDEVFAVYAIRNNLPLILSIPANIKWHQNRDLSRGMRAQAVHYDRILEYKNIAGIYEIGKQYGEGNHQFVNFARNQHMVDIADYVFCFKAYDSTGTDDCINRAKKANKFATNLANS